MTDGQNTDVETVDSAASAFAALLSSEEEHPETRKAPAPKEPTDDSDVENEPEAEVDEESTSEDDDQVETDDVEDTDDQEDADDAEETEEEPSEPRKFRVKVDGQDIEVTEDELLKGYSRHADYTRKTQKHSEDVKAFETESSAVREERKQLADQLTQLKSAIESLTPAEPDWDKLREENPEEFPTVWAEWQQHKDRLAKLNAKQQEALKKVQEDQAKDFKKYIENEQTALITAIPEWKNPEVAKKEAKELGEYALTLGFSEAEVNSLVDHRPLLMLRKAMLYDKLQQKKPVVKQKIETVKSVTPGAKQKVNRQKSEFAKRSERLKKSGSVKDAAALFEMLDD